MAQLYFGSPESQRVLADRLLREELEARAKAKVGKPYVSPKITSRGVMAVAPGQSKIARNMLLRGAPGLLSNLKRNLGKLGTHPQPTASRVQKRILARAKIPPVSKTDESSIPSVSREKRGPVSFTPRKLHEAPGGRGEGVEFGSSPQLETGSFQSDQAAVYSKVIDELKKAIQANTDPRVRTKLDEKALARRREVNELAREQLAGEESLEPQKDPYESVPEDFLTEEDIENRLKRAQAALPPETQAQGAPGTNKSQAEVDNASEAFWAKKSIGKRKKLENEYLDKVKAKEDFEQADKFFTQEPRISAHHVADFMFGSEPARPVSKGVLGEGIVGTPMDVGTPGGDDELPEGMQEAVEGIESPHEMQRREYLSQFGSPLEQYLQERGRETSAAAESLGRRSPLPPALQFRGGPTGVAGKVMYASPKQAEVRKTEKLLKQFPSTRHLKVHHKNLKEALKQLASTGAVPSGPKALRGRYPERAPKSEVERLKELPPGTAKEKVVSTLMPPRSSEGRDTSWEKTLSKFANRRRKPAKGK